MTKTGPIFKKIDGWWVEVIKGEVNIDSEGGGIGMPVDSLLRIADWIKKQEVK